MLGKPTLKPDLERASHRVNRGGSWFVVPRGARVAYRDSGAPVRRFNDLGFRLVRDQEEPCNKPD